jgi:hypothetical protein
MNEQEITAITQKVIAHWREKLPVTLSHLEPCPNGMYAIWINIHIIPGLTSQPCLGFVYTPAMKPDELEGRWFGELLTPLLWMESQGMFDLRYPDLPTNYGAKWEGYGLSSPEFIAWHQQKLAQLLPIEAPPARLDPTLTTSERKLVESMLKFVYLTNPNPYIVYLEQDEVFLKELAGNLDRALKSGMTFGEAYVAVWNSFVRTIKDWNNP